MRPSASPSSICRPLSEMLLIGFVVLVSTTCVAMTSFVDDEQEDEFFSGSGEESGERATNDLLLDKVTKDTITDFKGADAALEDINKEDPKAESTQSGMTIGVIVGCIALVVVVAVVVIIAVVVRIKHLPHRFSLTRGKVSSTENSYEAGQNIDHQYNNEYYTKIRPASNGRSSVSNSSSASHGSCHPIYDEI